MLSLIWLSTLDIPAGMVCWESQEQNSKAKAALQALTTHSAKFRTHQAGCGYFQVFEWKMLKPFPSPPNTIQLIVTVPLLSVWIPKQRLFWRGCLYLWGPEFEPSLYHMFLTHPFKFDHIPQWEIHIILQLRFLWNSGYVQVRSSDIFLFYFILSLKMRLWRNRNS